MMGAGMVILQPSTDRVVVVHDSVDGHWFLPRGRKDIGESLEKTALREAYEEVCLAVRFHDVQLIYDIAIISMYSRDMRLSFYPCIVHRVPLLLLTIQKHFSA
jgi:ADP-ribose pyrophosphatase YjhB (NUDIX family)